MEMVAGSTLLLRSDQVPAFTHLHNYTIVICWIFALLGPDWSALGQ